MKNKIHKTTMAALLMALLLPAAVLAGPGWMGVGLGEITPDRVAALKLKEERGVEILSVQPGSPAAQAGLKEKDVVLEFNGARVDGTEQLSRMVRETPPGRQVRLLITRDGAPQTVTLKLAEKKTMGHPQFEIRMPKFEMPEIHISPDIQVLTRTSRLGIDGLTLTKQLGEFFGVPDGAGVLVSSVEKDSPAEKAGIKAGDVIIRLDGEKIGALKDLRSTLRDKASKTSLPVVLIRNKREMTVTAQIERRERGNLERMRGDLERIIEKAVVEAGGLRL